ncbi:hypothetical protein FRACYDRAFT_236384 [Fragilariopsis cylindrus CCMP1102]|uniref:Uncharacterized protein n=1 Tax=Fragilariopsis cylindrus CCMP1102 TaxID=635003 RepID=A0A1E7FQ56_9STRA|nr:hypothetical protein FRACYDRAFT_236384 [Fragilariopsis cylindrus CCMP1102]|eukprot:OEU20309.1 hypothetical protein FRACYDRAFT_236384 [Fragilariopsis cylindrus CCMP1102]
MLCEIELIPPMSVSQPATTLSEDNRDESLRDIIANSDLKSQRDLGALMSFCIQHIPTDDDDRHEDNDDDVGHRHDAGVDDQKIAFIEGISLVVMYVKMGLIDLHADNHMDFDFTSISYRTNDDGRIIMLHIDPYVEGILGRENDNFVPYNLPKDILRFQSLEDLTMWSCRCIPDDVDLASLPHLQKLGFYDLEYMSTRSVPSGMNFPRLKELVVDISHAPLPSDFVSWMTSQLPNLEILSFHEYGASSTGWDELFLDALISDNLCFQDSLKQMNFEYCNIAHNSVLKRIIRSVLPRFAHLGTINYFDRNTTDFRFLSILTATTPLPRTIHSFILSMSADNADRKMALRDPTERMALLKFLKLNTSVYNVMSGYRHQEVHLHDYHPDIKYLLLINHAGESVVVENVGSTANRNHNDPPSIVPSSVLPILLERSYHQSDNIYHKRSPLRGTKDHTGMYYLLRHNITALIGDRSVTMDNRDANQKVVATRK